MSTDLAKPWVGELMDMGGAAHNAKAYPTLDAAIAALTGPTRQRLIMPPGLTRTLSADTTVPANITIDFQMGVIETNGHALTLNQFSDPGDIQCFDVSGGGTVTIAAGVVDRVRASWYGGGPGASPATNSMALAATLATHADTVSAFTPTGGSLTAGLPSVTLTPGRWQIDDELPCSAWLSLVCGGLAVIEQTDPAKRILVNTTDAYYVNLEGIRLVGGTRQLDLANANVDSTQFSFERCEFHLSSDWAVHIYGTLGLSSPTTSTTLAVAAVGGDDVIELASAAGLTPEDVIAVVNDNGEVHFSAVVTIAGADLTLREPLPAHWTGAAQASVGNGVKVGDFHTSAQTVFRDARWIKPRRCFHNYGDSAKLIDSWVYVDKTNFDANRAAFVNRYGSMVWDNVVGVPSMGTQGVDRLASVRWVDNYGQFRAHGGSRFGGEYAGMPPVYNFCGVSTIHPFQGATITITDCDQVAGGPAAAADSAVVCLMTHVPGLIVVQQNRYIADIPLIRNLGGLNLDTYFDAHATPHDKFRIALDPNSVIGEVSMPAQLLPYVQEGPRVSMAAAPTSGIWKVGQKIRDSAPAVSGSPGSEFMRTGWVCTTAGKAGAGAVFTPVSMATGIRRSWQLGIQMADDAQVGGTPFNSVQLAGVLHVSMSNNAGVEEAATFHIGFSSVRKVSGTTNTAATDTDGNLCVFLSGNQVIIRNRLGTTVTALMSAEWFTA